MIKAVPYILTKGSEKFKEFLANPFTTDLFNTHFDGWRERGTLNGWMKFVSDEHTLEFYPTYYTLKKNKPADSTVYMLSTPKEIDDFITDMSRFGIQLYWTNWIDENFEPKEYLPVTEIKDYFTDLLGKMGKSHELM